MSLTSCVEASGLDVNIVILIVPPNMIVDYYGILNVDATATQHEIKTAFRKLAKKYHPDVNQQAGASEKFKDIYTAYEVLTDKGRKDIYDDWREEDLESNSTPYEKPDMSGWENQARARADKYANMRYGEFRKAELRGFDFIQDQLALSLSIAFLFLVGGAFLYYAKTIVTAVYRELQPWYTLFMALLMVAIGFALLRQALFMGKALRQAVTAKFSKKRS